MEIRKLEIDKLLNTRFLVMLNAKEIILKTYIPNFSPYDRFKNCDIVLDWKNTLIKVIDFKVNNTIFEILK